MQTAKILYPNCYHMELYIIVLAINQIDDFYMLKTDKCSYKHRRIERRG